MRRGFCRDILTAVILFVFCFVPLVSGADAADAIRGLIGEGLSAGSLKKAEAKLEEAKSLYERRRSGIPLPERDFLELEVQQAQARVWTTFWQQDPGLKKLCDKAREKMLLVRDRYEVLVKQCEDRLDIIENNLGSGDVTKNKKWQEASGYISRANYGAAWTEYYLGLVMDDPKGCEARLNEAVKGFMGFTARGFRRHPIVADCFLGQALCYYELGRYFDLAKLLEPISAENVSPKLFKRMTYLRLKAYLEIPSYLKAESAARQYFDALKPDHKLDNIELGMAIDRAECLAILASDSEANPYHEKHDKQLDKVIEQIYSYGEPWRTELAKMLGDSPDESAFESLTKARVSFEAKEYVAALREVDNGLKVAGKESGENVLSDLRYTRTACYWNLKRWGESHTACGDFLKHHGDDRRAGEVVKMGIESGLRGMKAKPPVDTRELLAFFSMVEEKFSDIDGVERVPWHRAGLLINLGKYAEAEKALEGVGPDSPVYIQSQYGLALSCYKQAERLMEGGTFDSKKASVLLDRTRTAIEKFVKIIPSISKETESMKSAMGDIVFAASRRYLQLAPPQADSALNLIDIAMPLGVGDADSSNQRLAIEIEANVSTGRIDKILELVDQGLKQKGSNTIAPMMVVVAGDLEKRCDELRKKGENSEAEVLTKKLIDMYGFVLDYVDKSKDKAVQSQEASVHRKLGELLLELERYSEAKRHFQWLEKREENQKDASVLRGLGLCSEKLGRYKTAIPYWRILSKGLEKKTDGWYEAKYHLIFCYFESSQTDRGQKLLAYFRLQYPTIESKVWSEKFDELGSKADENRK